MPEKPKALSPSIAITCSPLTTAAATEKPMPMPMTPHVPTSSRLRGLYMSTMLRVKSSAFAPSLTRMASGFALTMSRTTFSALWKFIGDGFFASDSPIFATFLVLRSAMASSHSAGGFGQFAQLVDRAEHGRDARTDVADDRRIDADVAVRLLRRDVDLDELLAAPLLGRSAAPRLALALRQQPVEPRTDQHHDVGFRQHVRARRGRRLLVRVGQQALGHRHRAGRGCRSFPPARECPRRPARTPRPCRE